MSDLNEEKREEEQHRHEINERYGEMEKLKIMLKEEEDTWTSKLQSWKTRRRSVTEDARKRKEERDSIEKEVEVKTGRRKTKTYKEIVEDKMKRDKELAQLNDHDEYEFVSPRSSTVTSPTNSTSRYTFEGLVADVQIREKERKAGNVQGEIGYSKETSEKKPQTTDSQVQYKYTTKVTAVINDNAPNMSAADNKKSSIQSTVTHEPVRIKGNNYDDIKSSSLSYTPKKSRTLPRDTFQSYDQDNDVKTQSSKIQQPTKSPNEFNFQTKPVQRENHSNVPNVLLRVKNPNARKERPKSAHELTTGSSSSLPRNYHDYSAPKPFTPGSSSFSQYRKTNFANRRSMWENISRSESQENLDTKRGNLVSSHKKNSSDELVLARNSKNQSAMLTHSQLKPNQREEKVFAVKDQDVVRKSVDPQIMKKFSSNASTEVSKNTGKSAYPAKVPLVSRAQITPTNKFKKSSTIEQDASQTATLSVSGLSMTSPRVSKTSPVSVTRQTGEQDSLFDDMKICINQRPRSEKGFGFTVRGGDDGKPVIVDTVSPGGAADICHLCVSDEILAINDVPLADCNTQDDIVQLIVSSVITGNLSLSIRRYGKAKKASPLRLSGTKVVMTPGGFVQVRSDKPLGRTQEQAKLSPATVLHKEISISSPTHTDDNNNDMMDDDLPPPPTQQELASVHFPSAEQDNNRSSPLSRLVTAASNMQYPTSSDTFPREIDGYRGTALSEVHSDGDDMEGEEELRRQVIEAQNMLDFEQIDQYDLRKREDEKQLRIKLQEEQRKLEMEEAQREEIRRKMQEEALLEDQRVEEELRKIQARKMKQQEQRRKGMKSYMEKTSEDQQVPTAPPRSSRSNGFSMMRGSGQHWMIEEAERRRVAEMEGKPRANVLQYGRNSDSRSGSGLPDHVIQRLTHRAAAKSTGPRPFVKEPTTPFWNDPNAKATLL